MKRFSTCAAALTALLLSAAPAAVVAEPNGNGNGNGPIVLPENGMPVTTIRSSRPTVMLGVAFNFGGGSAQSNVGITLKLLHSDRRNRAVGAVGVSFFPWGDDVAFGLDAGIGYTGRNAAAVISYDFLNASPQFSAGWAHTRSRTVTTWEPNDVCGLNGSCDPE